MLRGFLARVVVRLTLWSFACDRADTLAAGEKMLVLDPERHPSVGYWVVSTHAVYIVQEGSAPGRTKTRRIPFERIDEVSEINQGDLRIRTLRVAESVERSRELSGCFTNQPWLDTTKAIREQRQMRAPQDRASEGPECDDPS